MEELSGTLFQIQRFSLHDGPGVRTTVFFKGCNLRCAWCHNPESFTKKPQLMFLQNRCASCGRCVQICPQKAVFMKDGELCFDRSRCHECMQCTEVCLNEARTVVGERYSVSQVMEIIRRDLPFYRSTGGGVTFSGGEPLLQPEFLKALLLQCNREKIHTTVETALNLPQNQFSSLLPLVDLWKVDCKLIDSSRHKQATGAENSRILENIEFLSRQNVSLTVNIPLIPGINDDEENLTQTAEFLKTLPHRPNAELLAFHKMAENKYLQLGLSYPAKEYSDKQRESLDTFRSRYFW